MLLLLLPAMLLQQQRLQQLLHSLQTKRLTTNKESL
jgi:hypothetical protein